MPAMTAKQRKAKQELFLLALGKCASIKNACAIADVSRATIYRWRDTNKTFREALEVANLDANDTIDDEICRRALDGIEEPLVSMGKLVFLEEPATDDDGNPLRDDKGKPLMRVVGQVKVRKYSDSLLLALAKSRMKKYRDRTDLDLLEQINEQTGGQVSINTKDMTGDEIATLKQLAQSIKVRQESQETR